MQFSNTQLFVLLIVSSFVRSEDCACHQCSNIGNESRRCECCVYMLHGKRSGARVLTSNGISDFDGARNDNHGDESRAYNVGIGKIQMENKVDESNTGTISRSMLFQILNGKLVTDYLDVYNDFDQPDSTNRDFFKLFLKDLEGLWDMGIFQMKKVSPI